MIRRLAIGSGGTMATRASTRRRAALSGPNNARRGNGRRHHGHADVREIRRPPQAFQQPLLLGVSECHRRIVVRQRIVGAAGRRSATRVSGRDVGDIRHPRCRRRPSQAETMAPTISSAARENCSQSMPSVRVVSWVSGAAHDSPASAADNDSSRTRAPLRTCIDRAPARQARVARTAWRCGGVGSVSGGEPPAWICDAGVNVL